MIKAKPGFTPPPRGGGGAGGGGRGEGAGGGAAAGRRGAAARRRPPNSPAILRRLPSKTTPMEVRRTCVSALSAFDPDAADNSRDATLRKSIRLTAQLPTLVAAWERIRRGKTPAAPDPGPRPP